MGQSRRFHVIVLVNVKSNNISLSSFSKYQFKSNILQFQALISFFITFYVFFFSNPFDPNPAYLLDMSVQGLGLNPLLQDVGLATHPPILYFGYAGTSLMFSYAMLALSAKFYDPKDWGTSVRPWSLLVWAALLAGVILGASWAYRELGWGGFWFWDPVENSSLIPLVFLTGFLHSILSMRKFSLLKRASIFLGLLSFLTALLGFFMVRSGVVSSVHAFATDPSRGIALLGILGIFTLNSVYLFTRKMFSADLKLDSTFSLFSRHGLVISNVILSITLGFILVLGNTYPIFSQMVFDNPISVGAPYYNLIFVPITALVLFFMIFTPYMKWPAEKISDVISRSKTSFIISAIISALIVFGLGKFDIISASMFFLGFWLVFSLVEFLVKRKWKGEKISRGFFAMCVSHIGFGMFCLFIALTTSQEKFVQFVLDPKKQTTQTIEGQKFTYLGRKIAANTNYLSNTVEISLEDKAKNSSANITKFYPENRVYTPGLEKTHEVSLLMSPLVDRYMVIGEVEYSKDETPHYPIKYFEKPFMVFIWLSALIMIIGAVIAIPPKK